MRALLGLFFTATLLVILGAGAAIWWLQERYLPEPGPLRDPLVVELPRGVGVASIAERLESVGAIDNALLFRLAARASGQDRSLKAGEYEIAPASSPEEILRLLESGKVLLHPLTLPEGITVIEAMRVIDEAPMLTGELPETPEEGSLLPETYLIARSTSRATLVKRMQAAMQARLQEVWETRAEELPLKDPQELLILASIIEKETAVAQEYPLVASVFVNRLKRGMPLQTDPTVIYAITQGKEDLGRPLTRADLKVESPWNTYHVSGLPPTPIALPGAGAIEAAAHPAETKFVYFVADGSGGHAFAETLQQHNANVTQWRLLKRQGAN